MSDGTPQRRLPAAEVAKALGRKSKRVVLTWVALGLPHDVARGRGGTRFLFNLDEVKAFLAEQGLDVVKDTGPELPFEADEEEGAVDLESLLVLTDDGHLDWDAIIAKAGDQLLNPQTKQTQAFKYASSELRALAEARHKADERAKKFIPRATVEEVVIEEAAMFTADLDALATELPRQIIADLAASRVDHSDNAQVARVLAETVRRATDAVRRRRAGSIRRANERCGLDHPDEPDTSGQEAA